MLVAVNSINSRHKKNNDKKKNMQKMTCRASMLFVAFFLTFLLLVGTPVSAKKRTSARKKNNKVETKEPVIISREELCDSCRLFAEELLPFSVQVASRDIGHKFTSPDGQIDLTMVSKMLCESDRFKGYTQSMYKRCVEIAHQGQVSKFFNSLTSEATNSDLLKLKVEACADDCKNMEHEVALDLSSRCGMCNAVVRNMNREVKYLKGNEISTLINALERCAYIFWPHAAHACFQVL